MFPYWLLFFVCAIGAFLYRHRSDSGGQRTPLLVAAGLFISLMVGLRFEVGGDWFAYVHIFERLHYVSLGSALSMSDPGYAAVNWIVQELGFDIWLVNLICASIFTWGLMHFVSRQPNPWLAIAVAVPYLIVVVAMGYTRQAVAIGFIMAALGSVRELSVVRFSLLILLAATFHKTAIVMLPLMALSQTRNKIIRVGLFAVLFLILFQLFVSSELDRLMQNYVKDQYLSQGAAIRISMNLAAAVTFLILRKRFKLSPADDKLWLNFVFASMVLLGLFILTPSSTVVDRLALYIIPLQLFVFSRAPTALGIGGRSSGQITLAVIAYSALVLFIWLNYATHAEDWIPYKMYPF